MNSDGGIRWNLSKAVAPAARAAVAMAAENFMVVFLQLLVDDVLLLGGRRCIYIQEVSSGYK